jgi:hypothetical protein
MPRVMREQVNPFQRAVKTPGAARRAYIATLPRTKREVVAARVRVLCSALLDGMNPNLNLVDYIRECEADPASPFYVVNGDKPMCYAMCRRLAQRAEQTIAEMAKEDREQLLAKHLVRRERLYQRAVQKDDVKGALAVLDSLANLLGLFPEKNGLQWVSGAVNLQVLVQAVINAEAKKTGEAMVEVVPGSTTIIESNGEDTVEKIEGNSDHGATTESSGECRNGTPIVRGEEVP